MSEKKKKADYWLSDIEKMSQLNELEECLQVAQNNPQFIELLPHIKRFVETEVADFDAKTTIAFLALTLFTLIYVLTLGGQFDVKSLQLGTDVEMVLGAVVFVLIVAGFMALESRERKQKELQRLLEERLSTEKTHLLLKLNECGVWGGALLLDTDEIFQRIYERFDLATLDEEISDTQTQSELPVSDDSTEETKHSAGHELMSAEELAELLDDSSDSNNLTLQN